MIPTETPVAAPSKEPSIADLRKMLSAETTPAVEPVKVEAEPKPETTEPKAGEKPPEVKAAETAPVPVETKPTEEVEDQDPELPEKVQKRIAAEVKKQAFFDQKIREAVSARKAKEAEAAALTTGKPGSEPEPTTEPTKDARPEMPEDMPDITTFDGTSEEFKAASDKYKASVKKYNEDYQKWLEGETRRTVTAELAEQRKKDEAKAQWDTAVKTHGAKFEGLMNTLAETVPVALQNAVSALDNWSGVAVHLAEHPDELAPLVAKFEANPYSAIAELGKLEERLKPAAKPQETVKPPETPLPAPLKPVGGDAQNNGKVDLEKASMSVFKKEMNALGIRA